MQPVRPQVVPALEAETVEQLARDANRVAGLTSLLHYDVADGQLVASRTPAPADYPKVPEGIHIFWHLMVQDPVDYLDACLDFPTELVTVAAEARGAAEAIGQLNERGIRAALALAPPTWPRDVVSLIDTVSVVQIMTVEPGGQGRPFQPAQLGKVAEVRALNPALQIAIDGGVSAATIEAVVRYRPTYIAVGSALAAATAPADVWQTLNRLVDATMSRSTT